MLPRLARDEAASNNAIFDGSHTDKANCDTQEVRKYGAEASDLIFVLDLENSATRGDDLER